MFRRVRLRQLGLVLCLALVAAAPAGTPAAQSKWGWFRGTSIGSEWRLTYGEAAVSVAGASFSAELRDHAHQLVRVSLQGTLRDGQVTVLATVLHTDRTPAELTGRLRRLCWEGGGREMLVLTNGIQVISLARELPAEEPCEPDVEAEPEN